MPSSKETPRLLKPPVSPTKRAWSPLAVSAVVHLVVLVAAAGLTRRAALESPERAEAPADDSRRIEMVYLQPPEPSPPPAPAPPPAPVRPPPPLRPPAPPPTVRRTVPEPEPNAPPEAVRTRGTEATAESKAEPAPPVAGEKATMESEARRIFGRPRLATAAGAGPQAIRPMEAWFPERPDRCIPQPALPGDSAGPAQYGTVTGRIFRQDNGRPLAGAHLHMIGTPYVAFTDGGGEYRFRFDLALMDNCRTQYVKVTAGGYESRLLVLVVGPRVRSEDVRLRRQ